jgi:hypothetical protein
LSHYFTGVELLNGIRGPPAYLPQPNSEYRKDYLRSQTVGDNVHSQEGNNPDRQLRSPSLAKFIRKLDCRDSQDVGLEAATI